MCQAFLGMYKAMQSLNAFNLLCMDAEILSETSLHEITSFPRDISVFLLVINVDAVCPLKWKCSAIPNTLKTSLREALETPDS